MVVGLAVMWCLVSLSDSSEGVEVQPNGQQTRASTDGSEVNIARSRTAVAFAHSKKFGPENAVDGNMQTRYADLSQNPFRVIICSQQSTLMFAYGALIYLFMCKQSI